MLNEQEMARTKELLDRYYEHVANGDRMAIADAYDELKLIAEDMVDFITDIRFPE